MSKKRNRAFLNKAEDGHSYKILLLDKLFPIYWDDGCNFHYTSNGPSWGKKWKVKTITRYDYRTYRTWKYNRKTQWK